MICCWVALLLVVLGEAPVPYFTLRLQVLPARPLFLTFILNTLGETVVCGLGTLGNRAKAMLMQIAPGVH